MSAWKDFVTAALLGTEKGGATPVLPGALAEPLGAASALDREAEFLTRAGALAWWRRTGWKPLTSSAPTIPPAPAETAPLLNAACAAHLRAMLGGHCADSLPEWLGEAARRGRSLPPELLPALLDWARQNRTRRPLLNAAGGARLRWLATQNPDWNFAADDSPEHWETGSQEQRLAILRAWRASDPKLAREKLEPVWSTETADVRAAFLGLLEDGLCDDDAPFLERALDDRGKDVRARAVLLLRRLSDSPLAERMKARATPLLIFKPGGLLKRAAFEVTLPGEPDAAALRDDLAAKPFGAHKVFGEKAGRLASIIACVPLSHWTQSSGQEPTALLKAVEKNDFVGAVVSGWTLAALHQRDAAWAEALLDLPEKVRPPREVANTNGLSCLLPEAKRAARLMDIMRRGGLGHRDSWGEIEPLIRSFDPHLPIPVAQNLLHEMRVLAGIELPWHVHYALTTLATKIPPRLLPLALDDWPEPNPAADLVTLLSFRRDALAALAQP